MFLLDYYEYEFLSPPQHYKGLRVLNDVLFFIILVFVHSSLSSRQK